MKNILKKSAIAVLSFALIIGSFYIGSKGYEMQLVNSGSVYSKPIIIVDAGHGGLVNTTD